jgi:hypothetical protein
MGRDLPRRMSLLLAQSGHDAMSDLSPECAPKRTSADHSEFMVHAHAGFDVDRMARA